MPQHTAAKSRAAGLKRRLQTTERARVAGPKIGQFGGSPGLAGVGKKAPKKFQRRIR